MTPLVPGVLTPAQQHGGMPRAFGNVHSERLRLANISLLPTTLAVALGSRDRPVSDFGDCGPVQLI